MKRRGIALAAALLLLLGQLPAFAAQADTEETEETVGAEETTPDVPFEADVAGKWYHDVAVEVYRNGWMEGVGADGSRFGGEEKTTRGMVIDAIWRMAGSPAAQTSIGYVDVEAQNPYHNALDWAVEQGIVNGYDDGRIGVDDPVTREQLATLLYRYAQKQGKGFVGTWMLLLDVTDRSDISPWAYESACWLFMKNVMTGREGRFAPKDNATRAELAATLVKYSAAV